MKENKIEKELIISLGILYEYVENVKLRGTSVMNGVFLAEVNGIEYEVQLRLERDKNLFIGPSGCIETIGTNLEIK